jgi:hypothetical protein
LRRRKEFVQAKEQLDDFEIRGLQIRLERFRGVERARRGPVWNSVLGNRQREEEILRVEMHLKIRDFEMQT